MNTIDLLLDLAARPLEPLEYIDREALSENLNTHPGGHDNSAAWLLWHTGREIDVQLSLLSKAPEVWAAQGYKARLGLGELGDTVGYGHTAQEARAIYTEDAEGLFAYLAATIEALQSYIKTLGEADLDEVIDRSYTPHVTLGTRLISIIEDASQHLAQAAYIAGMKGR